MKAIYIFFIVILFAFIFLFWYFYIPITDTVETKTVEFKEGQMVTQFAEQLTDARIVRQSDIFRFVLRLKGLDRSIQTGIYNFTPPFSIVHALNTLLHPEKNEVEITIIPGWDLRDITEYLVKQRLGTEEEFVALLGKSATLRKKNLSRNETIAPYVLATHLPETATLEGYLAPDTYRVFANATPEEILKKLFAHRDAQFTEQMYNDILLQKRSVHEIMIMASLLEREVQNSADRKNVSDLFWRRYDLGWALQADSTVHYALGKKGNVFTTSLERKTDSPWNTYKYPGLPIGPIATPSLDAIMAAIYPEKNDYWYFLTTSDGQVKYAKTLEEHNANKIHL